MPFRLTVYSAEGVPSRHVLRGNGPWEIGRRVDPRLGVRIDDPRVSRRHARLERRADSWVLTDLGSKNGTRLDGKPLATADLPSAAWLSIGGVPVAWALLPGEGAPDDAVRRQTVKALDQHDTPAPERLLEQSLMGLVELTEASDYILWISNESGALEPVSGLGRGLPVSPAQSALRDRALDGGDIVIGTPEAECSDLAAPLQLDGRMLGVVLVSGCRSRLLASSLDQELLSGLVSQLAVAAGLSSLHRRIRMMRQPFIAPGSEARPAPMLWRLLRSLFPAYRQ